MNKIVYAILESDRLGDGSDIIGVASTPIKAMELIKEYYGKYAVYTKYRLIQDKGLEFDIKVTVDGCISNLVCIWFAIDEL